MKMDKYLENFGDYWMLFNIFVIVRWILRTYRLCKRGVR